MSITLKNKYLFLGIIVAILALFFVGMGIGIKKGKDALKPTVIAQEKELVKYTTKIKGLEVYVSKKEQEVMTLQEALKKTELSREEIRKLHLKSLQEIVRLKLVIDTLVAIPTDHQVIIKDTCISGDQSAVLLPYSFKKADKWLTLNGTIHKSGVVDVVFKMPLAVDVFTDYDRKLNKYTVTVTTSNPYLGTEDIKSQQFDALKEKKWGIGLLAGYGLTLNGKPQFTPWLGVGVSRNIIRF